MKNKVVPPADAPKEHQSTCPVNDEKSLGKKVLPIKEKKDGTLMIGDGEYTIDEFEMLQIPQGKLFPRIRIKELRDHIEGFEFEAADGVLYSVSLHKEDYIKIGFDFYDNVREWWGKIGLYAYIELLEACIKRHPEHVAIIEFSRRYIGSADVHFDFAVRVSDEFLDDSLTKGLELIAKILQPITEIEALIDQTIAGGVPPSGAQADS